MGDSDYYERDELDDIIDASDTDTTLSTTASSIASSFLERNHFVLELHELQKNDPEIERLQVKKLKRRAKGPPMTKRNDSSDSSDDERVPPCDDEEPATEQYFDAHDINYGITDNEVVGNDEVITSHDKRVPLERSQKAKIIPDQPMCNPPQQTKKVRKFAKRAQKSLNGP